MHWNRVIVIQIIFPRIGLVPVKFSIKTLILLTGNIYEYTIIGYKRTRR